MMLTVDNFHLSRGMFTRNKQGGKYSNYRQGYWKQMDERKYIFSIIHVFRGQFDFTG